MEKKHLFAIIILSIVGVGALFWQRAEAPITPGNPPASPTSFTDCVAAGNMVMESYPRVCKTADNLQFVEDVGNAVEKAELILAATPRPNAVVKSPIKITGKARGYWFFEASFPIKLVTANDVELASGFATADGEWMTEDFVSFTSTLSFPPQPAGATGTLILLKDNPSGLPENDDALLIPVMF